MGSLEMQRAQKDFFKLVESVSTTCLPSFTIWMDVKLAQYKANGTLQPDTDEVERQHYPEWIARSLRQNLSFIFPETSFACQALSSPRVDPSCRPEDGRVMEERRHSEAEDSIAVKSEDDDDDVVIQGCSMSGDGGRRSDQYPVIGAVFSGIAVPGNAGSGAQDELPDSVAIVGSSVPSRAACSIGSQVVVTSHDTAEASPASSVSTSQQGGDSVRLRKSSREPRKPQYLVKCDEPQPKRSHTERSGKRKKDQVFMCSVCSKVYKSLWLLQSHVRLHTGVKPYGCVYCQLKFTHYAGYRYHVMKKHKDKPFVKPLRFQ